MGKHELEQYHPAVFRFAAYMLRDHHLAQDVTQETMLKAIHRKEPLSELRDAKAWLLQVAANLCKDHLRRKKTAVHSPTGLLSEPVGLQPEPWFRMLQRESCEELEATIEKLTEREQSVLYLSAFEEMSNSEIANVLQLTDGAVKVALSRARKSVRESIIQRHQRENQR